MTPSTDRIFQASDLRRDRAFSDEARRGGARLRDTDGLALQMVPEIEYGELHAEATAPREFVRAAGAVLAINQALDGGRSVAEIVSAGPWPWLDAFELGDLVGSRVSDILAVDFAYAGGPVILDVPAINLRHLTPGLVAQRLAVELVVSHFSPPA